jgi:ribose-phosphate pyrophosphokinase
MTAIGDVEGRNIVVLDDMIDTAGTITKVSDMMMEKGALSVRVYAAHPVLSGKAYTRISESALKEVVVTDTIPLRKDVDTSKITVISTAPLFADIINKIYNCSAISSTFVM